MSNVKPFETKEEVQIALARVFTALQQPGENRPALRAIEKIARINCNVSHYHGSQDRLTRFDALLKEAYSELEDALDHFTPLG